MGILSSLCVCGKLRKATIKFVMSVWPFVRTEQLGSHWTDLHEIWHLNILIKYVEDVQVLSKSDQNSGHFT